jgi:hypothetical protein
MLEKVAQDKSRTLRRVEALSEDMGEAWKRSSEKEPAWPGHQQPAPGSE